MAVKKARPKSNPLVTALLSSIVPEYAQGLPFFITDVLTTLSDDITTIHAEIYPDNNHTASELVEIIKWAIVDITKHEDWECSESNLIQDLPGRTVGYLEYKRR